MLKKLRKENGYTQKDIAEKLGYKSKSGYCMLESGQVKLSMEKAKILSKLYKVEITIFFEE